MYILMELKIDYILLQFLDYTFQKRTSGQQIECLYPTVSCLHLCGKVYTSLYGDHDSASPISDEFCECFHPQWFWIFQTCQSQVFCAGAPKTKRALIAPHCCVFQVLSLLVSYLHAHFLDWLVGQYPCSMGVPWKYLSHCYVLFPDRRKDRFIITQKCYINVLKSFDLNCYRQVFVNGQKACVQTVPTTVSIQRRARYDQDDPECSRQKKGQMKERGRRDKHRQQRRQQTSTKAHQAQGRQTDLFY